MRVSGEEGRSVPERAQGHRVEQEAGGGGKVSDAEVQRGLFSLPSQSVPKGRQGLGG